MKKIITAILVVALLVQTSATTAYAQSSSSLSISLFELFERLESVNSEVMYGGDIEMVEYLDEASEGMQYLLAYVVVDVSSGVTNLDVCTLTIGEDVYERVLEDNFLDSHGYTALGHGDTTTDCSGWVVFEVPDDVTTEVVSTTAAVSLGEATAVFGSYVIEEVDTQLEQTPYYGMAVHQRELEDSYLQIASAGNYTPESPYIIVNPYEYAPQTALIIFETEEAVSVTTVIQGKTQEVSVTNVIEEEKTYHEVPLVGLYGGANVVELTLSDGSSYTYDITTEEMNYSSKQDMDVLVQDAEVLSEGLYVLKDARRTVVDMNGDIRGYFTIVGSVSGIDEITEDGHIFFSVDSYTDYPTILELDFMGKVYREIDIPGITADHDAYLIDDTSLLINFGVMDLETYTYETYERDWSEIFNQSQGSFEVRDNGSDDWLHFNTVADGGDGYILVSMRNQHAVAKLSYPELELQWVLSVNEEACLNDQDKYLEPIGDDFEWFYSQHHVSMVSENEDGTMDITIFDNGIQRGLDVEAEYPDDELYSRMVCYRIDEENMTVEQIFEWGEEGGTDTIAYIHSSTQYIEESDTYLGNFDSLSTSQNGGAQLDRDVMNFIEVDSDGEIVWHATSEVISYRIEKCSYDTFYAGWEGLGVTDGEYAYLPTYVSEYDDSIFEVDYDTDITYAFNEITVNQNYMDVYGWAARTDDLAASTGVVLLITENIETGKSYVYVMNTDTSQVLKSDVSEEITAQVDSSAGFAKKKLDISGYEEGTYTLSLCICQDDMRYQVETEYTINIGGTYEEITIEDKLADQQVIVADMLAEFESGTYTLDNPYVVVDPYDIAPLSAVAFFETDQPASIEVIVEGLRGGETLSSIYEEYETIHQIPIYGLYSEEETTVTLIATYEDGTVEEYSMQLAGLALSDTAIQVNIIESNPEEVADGLTFYSPSFKTQSLTATDNNGDIRFFLDETGVAGVSSIEQLSDGTILVSSEKESTTDASGYYKTSYYKMDFTGYIYCEYLLEGIHHDMIELSNGNYLLVGNSLDGEVLEDTIYEVDSTTGEVVQYWDMDDYFPVELYDEEGRRIPAEAYQDGEDDYDDWLHINAIDENPETGEILISARQQDVVISMDYETGEINYIIGNHEIPLPDDLEEKLLDPIDEAGDFEWQYAQHDAKFLESGDIILFDNGTYRGAKDETGQIEASENYSRAVIYHVDEENMTIEQLWEFGTELGSETFATYISGVQELGEGHYLINFGGIIRDENGEASYNIATAFQSGGTTAVMIEVKDGEVIARTEVEYTSGLSGNIYRAVKLNPYENSERLNLQVTEELNRCGTLSASGLVTEDSLPTIYTDLTVLNASVIDNGVQLVVDVEVADIDEDAESYLYFAGNKGCYSIALGTGTSLYYQISKAEFPDDTYRIYLQTGSQLADLELRWTNEEPQEEAWTSVNDSAIVEETQQVEADKFETEEMLYILIVILSALYLLDKRNKDRNK